jgi:hypothetical protein
VGGGPLPHDNGFGAALLADGNTDLVERDLAGVLHFNGTFRNVRDVYRVLDALRGEGYRELVDREATRVAEVFETLFDHQRFTGRSGAFYGYEGLGCIYWHQGGKLLLAVQELALAVGNDEDHRRTLAEWYYDVRSGLVFNKAPDVYGAFPTDPYSHTPGYAGAKQPGMTGQVKEEVITRYGELGVRVEFGRIRFSPDLLRADEFLRAPDELVYRDVLGQERSISLEPGSLGFTYCQVPVVYRKAEDCGIVLHLAGGNRRSVEGMSLDRSDSAEIFRWSGAIQRLEVSLAPGLEV